MKVLILALVLACMGLSLASSSHSAADKILIKGGVVVTNGTYTPDGPAAAKSQADAFIAVTGAIGLLFAVFLFWTVSRVSLTGDGGEDSESGSLISTKESDDELFVIYETIRSGAKDFLWAEYQICFIFVAFFGVVICVLVSHTTDLAGASVWDFNAGIHTTGAFVIGASTSILAGYIGMMVAVYANARTTVSAKKEGAAGWMCSFNTAFRAGGVMGFSLCSLSMLILYAVCLLYRENFSAFNSKGFRSVDYTSLFECIAGYGLGGSAIAMFGRVGGGIFTKAADVGADLSGKVIGVGDGKKLDEDSPYNPACIADNVGDNVGDVAGMGSDLFGSFGEATCAAMLIGASSIDIAEHGWAALVFPLFISATGIVVCMVCSFVATDIRPVQKEEDVEAVLKVQLGLTSLVMTIVLYPVAAWALPETIHIQGVAGVVTPLTCYFCIISGLWGGCIIGFITEYYTSHSYQPVRDVARSTETGAATNIIYGLALGYQSVIIPVVLLSAIMFISLKSAGMYGVALAALGMLSTLATCLAIDVYGPISDNAGGIAEMVELPSSVRDKTDALDAAGNTTAAIGKGFAIGSAALVSLALFGAFITRTSVRMNPASALNTKGVNLLSPIVFASVLFGAMVPYWFSALTMRSVGEAAHAMVKEVARQFAEIKGLADSAALDFHERQQWRSQGKELVKPDYHQCIDIATKASLREMIAPGVLVIASPILVGTFGGVEAVSGLLAGAIVSSVQLAISMSNTGGAWDNAKKYTEKGELNGWFQYHDGTGLRDEAGFKAKASVSTGDACLTQKVKTGGQERDVPIRQWLGDVQKTDPAKYQKIMNGDFPVTAVDGRQCKYAGKKSQAHAAAVVGDTVGDPLKDTSGPALNIVMKLMAIISVVFANFFMSLNHGNGLFGFGDIIP
uniref:H(+)-exporting diphosphatase n=1 Tax=Cryptomonas curvata TaxID=233186 RepID=A0A7S0MT90_9CRYP|mmetsp:Transcript_53810/g.112357  ORF Transcript_53810/g.112357 Transcript_53810/m.112357 type:complete len:909 (+) Transcript_53810:15-2741(+)|eukprot:CAMPEP_0172182592 /NCGR_PEP_ID=MMETSP1050-20130122/18485_1 /TAXON_ID=233186 /ORGANISM="Cryptomonas curvata, Strain CCAP979/52" /LENGTH=908 /DNA_ID=CAMNT_0012856055 /DNA_START=15 /DNA_END=2741 /DNA_ORIENTATION=+